MQYPQPTDNYSYCPVAHRCRLKAELPSTVICQPEEVPLVKFSDRSSYQINRKEKELPGYREKATIKVTTSPDNKEALELFTTKKAMHSMMVEISAQDKAPL